MRLYDGQGRLQVAAAVEEFALSPATRHVVLGTAVTEIVAIDAGRKAAELVLTVASVAGAATGYDLAARPAVEALALRHYLHASAVAGVLDLGAARTHVYRFRINPDGAAYTIEGRATAANGVAVTATVTELPG